MSAEETRTWLERNGWEEVLKYDWANYAQRVTIPLPQDTGAKTSLVRRVMDLHYGPALLWITDWAAFPSCTNMELFYGYRKYLGEQRLLNDAPGHFIDSGDQEKLEALFCMCLYFYFDSILVWPNWDTVVLTSNDEVIDFQPRSIASREKVSEHLKSFSERAQTKPGATA